MGHRGPDGLALLALDTQGGAGSIEPKKIKKKKRNGELALIGGVSKNCPGHKNAVLYARLKEGNA